MKQNFSLRRVGVRTIFIIYHVSNTSLRQKKIVEGSKNQETNEDMISRMKLAIEKQFVH